MLNKAFMYNFCFCEDVNHQFSEPCGILCKMSDRSIANLRQRAHERRLSTSRSIPRLTEAGFEISVGHILELQRASALQNYKIISKTYTYAAVILNLLHKSGFYPKIHFTTLLITFMKAVVRNSQLIQT